MTTPKKKRDTLFAKFGLQLVAHQGAIIAGEDAMGLYAFCMLFSRANELDGFIPTEAAECGWSGDRIANRKRLKTLCSSRVNYMAETEHGYLVLKYSEFNETKAEVAERRAATKARVDRLREASVTRYKAVTRGVTNAFVPVSVSDLKSGSLSEAFVAAGPPTLEEPPALPPANDFRTPRPSPVRDPLGESFLLAAYATGIAKGKGSPYAPPGGPWAAEGLSGTLAAHGHARDGTPLKGEALAEWVTSTAMAFASDIAGRHDEKTVGLYSSFGPKGFAKWLNERGAKPQLRQRAPVQRLAWDGPAESTENLTAGYGDLLAKIGGGG